MAPCSCVKASKYMIRFFTHACHPRICLIWGDCTCRLAISLVSSSPWPFRKCVPSTTKEEEGTLWKVADVEPAFSNSNIKEKERNLNDSCGLGTCMWGLQRQCVFYKRNFLPGERREAHKLCSTFYNILPQVFSHTFKWDPKLGCCTLIYSSTSQLQVSYYRPTESAYL